MRDERPAGNPANARTCDGRSYTVSVTGFVDIPDDSMRGHFTAYTVDTVLTTQSGRSFRFRAHRRFREWRKLHASLGITAGTFPIARPFHVIVSDAAKDRRAKALESWLHAMVQRQDTSPDVALLRFLSIPEQPRPRPSTNLTISSRVVHTNMSGSGSFPALPRLWEGSGASDMALAAGSLPMETPRTRMGHRRTGSFSQISMCSMSSTDATPHCTPVKSQGREKDVGTDVANAVSASRRAATGRHARRQTQWSSRWLEHRAHADLLKRSWTARLLSNRRLWLKRRLHRAKADVLASGREVICSYYRMPLFVTLAMGCFSLLRHLDVLVLIVFWHHACAIYGLGAFRALSTHGELAPNAHKHEATDDAPSICMNGLFSTDAGMLRSAVHDIGYPGRLDSQQPPPSSTFAAMQPAIIFYSLERVRQVLTLPSSAFGSSSCSNLNLVTWLCVSLAYGAQNSHRTSSQLASDFDIDGIEESRRAQADEGTDSCRKGPWTGFGLVPLIATWVAALVVDAVRLLLNDEQQSRAANQSRDASWHGARLVYLASIARPLSCAAVALSMALQQRASEASWETWLGAALIISVVIKVLVEGSELAGWARLGSSIQALVAAGQDEATFAVKADNQATGFKPSQPNPPAECLAMAAGSTLSAQRAKSNRQTGPGLGDGCSYDSEHRREGRTRGVSVDEMRQNVAVFNPLLSIAERLLRCLPHELRELARPIAMELLHVGVEKSTIGYDQFRGIVQAVGATASLILTRTLLDPAGRMRLWLGLKALADSAPMEGRLPAVVSAFTRQRHAFELGMHGSLVLHESLRTETHVPLNRIYRVGSSPPSLVPGVVVGDRVRVRHPHKHGGTADEQEALFLAVVTVVHTKSEQDVWGQSDEIGTSDTLPRADHPDDIESVDVRYKDDVTTVFGDQPFGAGLNVLDQIPEVNATWRLWMRGISIDIIVPDDKAYVDRTAGERGQEVNGSIARSKSGGRCELGNDGGGHQSPTASTRSKSARDVPESQSCGPCDRPQSLSGSSPSHQSSEMSPPTCSGAECTPSLETVPVENPDVDFSDSSGIKTIAVDWEEPSDGQREAGEFGSLSFTIALPLVLIKANVQAGCFWADSMLLKLGRFSDLNVVFDHGEVHARLRVTAERDGAYLSFEEMRLACAEIRIESISDHSKRWGLLLGTVTSLQWLLKGFLERKLLGLISNALVAENKRHRLISWSELSVVRDLEAAMARWEASASRREAREANAVRTIQAAWGMRRRRRQLLAAHLVASRSTIQTTDEVDINAEAEIWHGNSIAMHLECPVDANADPRWIDSN